jgi:hypothetical protein
VSNPRYTPKGFAADPTEFGKRDRILWATPDDETAARQCLAAQLQHEFSYRILRRIAEAGISIKSYSSMTGQTYDSTVKMLRGDAVMRLDHIATAERLLGGLLESPNATTRAACEPVFKPTQNTSPHHG